MLGVSRHQPHSCVMTALTIFLLTIVAITLVATVWRFASRRQSLPCLSRLCWLVELDNPFTKTNRAAFTTGISELQKLRTMPGSSKVPISGAEKCQDPEAILRICCQPALKTRRKVSTKPRPEQRVSPVCRKFSGSRESRLGAIDADGEKASSCYFGAAVTGERRKGGANLNPAAWLHGARVEQSVAGLDFLPAGMLQLWPGVQAAMRELPRIRWQLATRVTSHYAVELTVQAVTRLEAGERG